MITSSIPGNPVLAPDVDSDAHDIAQRRQSWQQAMEQALLVIGFSPEATATQAPPSERVQEHASGGLHATVTGQRVSVLPDLLAGERLRAYGGVGPDSASAATGSPLQGDVVSEAGPQAASMPVEPAVAPAARSAARGPHVPSMQQAASAPTAVATGTGGAAPDFVSTPGGVTSNASASSGLAPIAAKSIRNALAAEGVTNGALHSASGMPSAWMPAAPSPDALATAIAAQVTLRLEPGPAPATVIARVPGSSAVSAAVATAQVDAAATGIRVHVDFGPDGALIWLGLDHQRLDSLPALARQLQQKLRAGGVRLAGVVCNGRLVPLPIPPGERE